MKFSTNGFWKKKNVCCEFIEIIEIIEDTGKTARIIASVNEQLYREWKTLVSVEHMNVGMRDYDKWQSYNPRGNRIK